MAVGEMEALKKSLQEADAKVTACVEVLEEIEAREPKTDEEKQKQADDLKVAQEEQSGAVDAFQALAVGVEKADEKAKALQKRQSVLDRIAEMTKPSDAAGKVTGQMQMVQAPAESAEVKDFAAQERAHFDAFRAFMVDEEGDLPEQKRDLLRSKCTRTDDRGKTIPRSKMLWNHEAVVPKFLSQMMWAQAGVKTILSIDNAVSNPSLAHNLVPEEFRATLLQLPPPPATVLGMVTRFPTNTGNLTFPELIQTDGNELGGMTWSWIDEAAAKPETEPQFGQKTIQCYELAGYTELSHKILIRSAIALEPLLAQLSRTGMALEMERVILNGAGDASGEPLGILNATGIRTLARAAAGAVGYADLKHLKHKVQFYHRDNARYILGDDVEEGLENVLDADGRPIFAASVASGPYDRIVGYPYHVSYNSPVLGQEGDVIYGNFRHYYLVVEEDVTIAKSDHYRFRNNVRAIKVFVNAGGRPALPRAFAYLIGVGAS